MTGRDAEREQLATALRPHETHSAILDALLSVVDRIANQRAAAELESRAQMVSARAAAEEHDSTGDAAEVLDEVSAWLTARAAALRASNGEGATT